MILILLLFTVGSQFFKLPRESEIGSKQLVVVVVIVIGLSGVQFRE